MRPAVPWLCFCLILTAAPDRPELSIKDVVNAASPSPLEAPRGVSPGEIVVLFPSNAGPQVLAGAQLDGEGRVTTLLGETRVWFDEVPAPIAYSVDGQVGVIVPYEVSNRKTTQVVVEYQGARSAPATLAVLETAPALFTLDSTGKGQAGMLNETGCCNSARNPAARGSVVALYATGDGQTSPPGTSGRVSAYSRLADFPRPKLPVKVTVGGQPAEILWAGAAPHAVSGLLQVNFRVPVNAPIGVAVPLVLIVGDSHSPEGVTMAVRSARQSVLVLDSGLGNDNVLNDAPAAGNRITKILAAGGYEVLTARNGQEALAQTREHPIDLAIVSLTVPEQELLETIAALRVRRPQLKIIATARALDAPALRSADLLGAQAVLTNSIASSQILRRARELLRSRPAPYVAAEQAPMFPLTLGISR